MSSLSDPVGTYLAVVPSDTSNLPFVTSALYVGGAGNVTVMSQSGETVTFAGLQVGWHPIRCVRIYSTGTAATSIIAVTQ